MKTGNIKTQNWPYANQIDFKRFERARKMNGKLIKLLRFKWKEYAEASKWPDAVRILLAKNTFAFAMNSLYLLYSICNYFSICFCCSERYIT